ncbi:MAG TPA: MoxR family ATPase [Gammaproteobacteria bacterium]|nr:MoxR family ATPase [Gammaproteobacteria bacterium]
MNDTVPVASDAITQLRRYIQSRIIGQDKLIDSLLIALLADGHLLVEGAPGLAKTRLIKVLAQGIEASFHRIQFTPDLLPADLTGTEVFQPHDGQFRFQQGPLFQNLVLADEINRAPAKVQSALLEAMAERQITVGRTTYALPELFMVMATQNPLEQEGTYPLPEAQLDRFLLYVRIEHPGMEEEARILALARSEAAADTGQTHPPPVIPQQAIFAARRSALSVHLAPALETYLLQLVQATRHPGAYHATLERWLRHGASPRASIALDRCSRVLAWLRGRDYVTPEDIQMTAPDILRHRILLSYEAEAEQVSREHIIGEILARVGVP